MIEENSVVFDRVVDTDFLAVKHKIKYVVVRYLQAVHKTKFIQKFVSLKGKRLLDFGCASSAFNGYLKENIDGVDLYGYDPSVESINHSKELFGFPGNKMFTSVDNISRNFFDVITSFFVYAYLVDKEQFWIDCFDLLKPGGFLFVEVDNYNGLHYKLVNARLDLGWSIDLCDVPSGLELVKVCSTPYPSNLSNVHFSTNFFYRFLKYSIAFVERLVGLPTHKVYVFRKVGGE